MLHLEAGVDLEEGDGAVLAHEELAGAGAEVAGFLEDGLGGFVEPAVLLLGEERGRGFLDEFLVAALQRAVAGGDHHHVAVGVGEALGLDVARGVQEALDEALAAAEGGDGLTDGGFEQFGDFLAGAGHLDAASAAAEGRLDGDRQAELVHELEDFLGGLHRVGRAGNLRGADLFGDVAGLDLVAQGGDRGGGGPDPGDAGVDHLGGELGVLGQEAVAGVDGVGAGAVGHLDQLVHHEVGLGGGVAAQRVGLVGELDVQGVAVRIRVDRHGGDAFIACGADDAHGDFAAVGDQHLAQRMGDCGGAFLG